MALFQKKRMRHQVTENTFLNHLEVMRANYAEQPVTSYKLPKPLWIRLHKNDPLQVVYRDAETVFQRGQIYYAALVQANEMLFQKGSNLDLPANVIYSTHPVAAKYPEFLAEIAGEMFRYKGLPAEQVPPPLREAVRIITDELDRASLDFTVSMPDPENPNRELEKIDVHFCSLIVFQKELPGRVLQGHILPVLAAPELSPAVLVLPGDYWTLPFYAIGGDDSQ